jgi:hypothetical protein
MVHGDKPKKVFCICIERRGTFICLYISPV